MNRTAEDKSNSLINFMAISEEPDWKGTGWDVIEIDTIAYLVAQLVLGQHRQVKKIIAQLDFDQSIEDVPGKSEVDVSIQMLTVTESWERSHRDGYLFQMISWIVCRLQKPECISWPPHTEVASKGFDGLAIKIDPSDRSNTIIYFIEDKASDNPRQTFLSEVVDGIAAVENREKDSELKAKVAVLVETKFSDEVERDAIIRQLIASEVMRVYRVCTAYSKGKEPENISIYKNFSNHVQGDVVRREGHLMQLDNLRSWMDEFSGIVIKQIEALGVSE